jgi:hypothetical protein
MRKLIVAAKIEYSQSGVITTLGVASGHYTADATGLFRRTWYPILDPSVSVEIGVSLPWESGGPTDTFGAVQLTNGADGLDDHLLDTLLTAQVSGLQTEIRRGYDDEAWDDLELVSITHNDRVAFDGESVTISQRSALDKTDLPIVQSVFDSDTPNPRIVNQAVPLLLGQCFQIEPKVWDAANGVWYVASNQSNISTIREGGARTDNFVKTDWGFQMLAGVNLQLTADAIGPEPTSASTTAVVDWDFDAWTSDDPDSIDVTESTASPFDATISEASGDEADITVSATPTGDTGWLSLVDPFEPIYGSLSGNGAWSSSGSGSAEDAVVSDDGTYATATVYGPTTLRVTGFDPAVPAGYAITGAEIELIADGTNVELMLLTVNQSTPGTRIASYIGVSGSGITASDITGTKTTHTGGGANFIGGGIGVRENTDAEDVNPGCHFTLQFKPATAGSATLNIYQVRIKLHYAPTIDIVRLFSPTTVLEPGERHTITIEATAADIYARWGGSDSSGGTLRDATDPFSTSLSQIDGAGRYQFEFVPDAGENFFGIEFKRLNSAGTATIDRITVEKRSDGLNRYKSLVPYIAEQVGLETADIDQTVIDQHDTDTGSPEIGWYISGAESMSQVMDIFARSLSGVWWRDRDAKIRSALWALSDSATPDYTIESITVDGVQQPIQIVGNVDIVSDPARQATERAVGAKNWRPLRVNETAGITEEFTEQDRANVIEDYRVIRRANFDSLNPWPMP